VAEHLASPLRSVGLSLVLKLVIGDANGGAVYRIEAAHLWKPSVRVVTRNDKVQVCRGQEVVGCNN